MENSKQCPTVIIPVTQALADYSLICGSARAYGVYTVLPDLTNSDDNTHYIELRVSVTSIGPSGATPGWSATTDLQNGLRFRGSGLFSGIGEQTIRLYAVAGSRATTYDPIVLTITAQTSVTEVSCKVTVRPAYTPKKIVAFGLNNTYGYALGNGSSLQFLQSEYNFGSLSSSTVPMVTNFVPDAGYTKRGAFAYRHGGNGGDVNVAANWTTIMSQKPDIVIIAYAADQVNAATASLIVNYLNAGGIVLHFAENNPSMLISRIFALPTGSITAARVTPENTTLAHFATDPIIAGPFQPAGAKHLGGYDLGGDTEASLYNVRGLPATGVVVYSSNTTAAANAGVTAFRTTVLNYCFFGEGGFFTSRQNTTFPTADIEPYAVTASPEYRPAARPVSSAYPNGAYNSFYFANMLAWAVEEAQFRGINAR
jgi:hypothetical protein